MPHPRSLRCGANADAAGLGREYAESLGEFSLRLLVRNGSRPLHHLCAPSAAQSEPTLSGQHSIGLGDRVVMNAEIDAQGWGVASNRLLYICQIGCSRVSTKLVPGTPYLTLAGEKDRDPSVIDGQRQNPVQ